VNAVAGALGRTVGAVREAASESRRGWSPSAWAVAGALAVAAAVPLVVTDPLRLAHLTGWLTFALAALGLGLVVGLGGLPSLAQGAFVGIGAFAAALLQGRGGWPVLPAIVAGALVAAATGAVTGVGVVRVRPVFVAVSTWLLAWLVAIGLAAFPRISGGADGIAVGPATRPWLWYELLLVLVAVATGLFALYARGLPGLSLAAVRERYAAATALGLPTARLRLTAFVLAAGAGGLAGGLEVQVSGVADPVSYDPLLSFELLAAVVLGGAARALGPLAGTAIVALAGVVAGTLTAAGALRAERFAPVFTAVLVFAALSLGGEGVVPPLLARLRRSKEEPVPRPARVRSDRGAEPLRAEGLTKRYGELVALDAFDLELRSGSVCALVGPNGSGKTTALRILAGAVRPDAGVVSLGGRDVTAEPTSERVRLGVVRTLQATGLFPELSALDNVVAGGFVRRRHGGAARTLLATPLARTETTLARSEAQSRLELVGLGALADQPAGSLTALEQRLLMLATAEASRPHVLLLDELAAGAGPGELDRVVGVLEELRGVGRAVLVVEHDFGLVRRVADHVVVLDAGRTIAAGRPDLVAADPDVRRAFLGSRH
jgi:branched-chain amino acid transport system ATP-binding protein/branched-chain amino acid transport system permease protein